MTDTTSDFFTRLLPKKPIWLPTNPCWMFTRHNYIGDSKKSKVVYDAVNTVGCGEIIESVVVRELKSLFNSVRVHQSPIDPYDCIIGNKLVEVRKLNRGSTNYFLYLGATSANNRRKDKKLKKFFSLMKGGYMAAKFINNSRTMVVYWIPTKCLYDTFGEKTIVCVSKLNKEFNLDIPN